MGHHRTRAKTISLRVVRKMIFLSRRNDPRHRQTRGGLAGRARALTPGRRVLLAPSLRDIYSLWGAFSSSLRFAAAVILLLQLFSALFILLFTVLLLHFPASYTWSCTTLHNDTHDLNDHYDRTYVLNRYITSLFRSMNVEVRRFSHSLVQFSGTSAFQSQTVK